jgi:(p)ppGpp synthase/HD superfamily hydrolase
MPGTLRMPEFAQGLPTTRSAVAYAQRMHQGQQRKVDGAPFIEHPLEVASLLCDAGAPDHVVAAGVLHDILEKTDATEQALKQRFGSDIAAIVRAVSEDPSIRGYERRKAALRDQVADAGPEAWMVFAADKLSKIRELRLPTAARVTGRPRRVMHYSRSVQMLQRRLPDFLLVSAAQRELDSLPATTRARPRLSEVH